MVSQSRKVLIAPSLEGADQGYLAEAIKALDKGGADIVHFDVEDEQFFPSPAMGIRPIADRPAPPD